MKHGFLSDLRLLLCFHCRSWDFPRADAGKLTDPEQMQVIFQAGQTGGQGVPSFFTIPGPVHAQRASLSHEPRKAGACLCHQRRDHDGEREAQAVLTGGKGAWTGGLCHPQPPSPSRSLPLLLEDPGQGWGGHPSQTAKPGVGYDVTRLSFLPS